MLIHQPHDLRGVDGGAAADGDDDIGVEVVHGGHALHSVLDLGINTDVVERGGLDAHGLQLVDDGLADAQLKQGSVGDDEGLLAVILVTQLLQRDRGAALLEVQLLGKSQPQHIFSPFCNSLDVQQLVDVGLTHEGGAAEGAGAQGQGGSGVEVIQVADTSKGGGHVDDDTAGLHLQAECADLFTLQGIDIQGRGVACAAFQDQLVADLAGFLEVLRAVHAQHGAQLLVCPGVVVAGVVGLGHQDLGVGGDLDACHLGQLHSGTANSAGLDAVGGGVEEQFAHLDGLFLVQEVAAAVLQLLLDLVIDAIQNGDVLLSGADHAVVEGLGVDDGSHRVLDVAAVVHDDVAVAGAHADGGSAGGVSSLHHAGAAGCHDQVHFLHHDLGHLDRGLVDPADDVLGQAGLHSGLVHDARSLNGAALGSGMGAQQDGVAGLQADQDLIDGGGGGVGGGGNGAHDTNGLRDAHGARGLVLLDDAAGLLITEIVEHMLGSEVVLDHLVLDHAHAGLIMSHLGQGDTGLVGCHSSLLADLIDLLLGEGCEHGLRLAHLSQLRLQCLNRIDQFNFLCHSDLLNFSKNNTECIFLFFLHWGFRWFHYLRSQAQSQRKSSFSQAFVGILHKVSSLLCKSSK